MCVQHGNGFIWDVGGDNTDSVHMDRHPGERIPVKDGELVLTESDS